MVSTDGIWQQQFAEFAALGFAQVDVVADDDAVLVFFQRAIEFIVAIARRGEHEVEHDDFRAGVGKFFDEPRPDCARPREIILQIAQHRFALQFLVAEIGGINRLVNADEHEAVVHRRFAAEPRLPVLREKFHLLQRHKPARPQNEKHQRADRADGEDDERTFAGGFHRFGFAEKLASGYSPPGDLTIQYRQGHRSPLTNAAFCPRQISVANFKSQTQRDYENQTVLRRRARRPRLAAPRRAADRKHVHGSRQNRKCRRRRDKATTPAAANELFKSPDLVRTGADSRAELTAPDQTITRVGANTVFSFEPASRNLRLEQGSVLFHSPKGLGGGTIKSGGAVAAVLGTTLIVTATVDGGFKVILLEGKGRVTLPNGNSVTLKAGQLVFVLPGGTKFSRVLDINLAKLIAGSLLVNGFSHPLPSQPLIQAAIDEQNLQIASGRAVDTGNPPSIAIGLNSLDPGSYQNAAHPPLSHGQLSQLIYEKPSAEVSGSPGGRGFTPLGF